MGILYCRAGQGSEEEMYNNQEAGPAFVQFLTLLGDVVRLKGFENYRAQLDTKSEAQGGGGSLMLGQDALVRTNCLVTSLSHIVLGLGPRVESFLGRLGTWVRGCKSQAMGWEEGLGLSPRP